MNPAQTLSIVIVNYNAQKHLENCLESLTSSPPATPHQIIVVDNASADGSVEAIRARWPGITLVEQPSNVGFAAGNNAGIRASDGALILLLNNDTIVPAGAIDALVARLLAHPDAAVAGPRLIDDAGRAELSFGPMISPLNEMRQKLTMKLHGLGVAAASRWSSGPRAASAMSTGSAGPAYSCTARMRNRLDFSTSGTSCTPKMSTSARPFAGEADACSSHPRPRSSIFAGAPDRLRRRR